MSTQNTPPNEDVSKLYETPTAVESAFVDIATKFIAVEAAKAAVDNADDPNTGAASLRYYKEMVSLADQFHKAVMCLAAHKKDGWYNNISDNVIEEINAAYRDGDHQPEKALGKVAPYLKSLGSRNGSFPGGPL